MKGQKIKVYTYTRVSTAMQIDGYSLRRTEGDVLSTLQVRLCRTLV